MKQHFRMGLLICLALTVVVVAAAVAVAATHANWRSETGRVVQKSGDKFLKQGHGRIIKAPELQDLMLDKDATGEPNTSNDPLILDVRAKADYDKCHIPGAIHIAFYDAMAEPENLDKLDDALEAHMQRTGNDDIVVYCHTGHTAGLLVGILGSMGYDVKNLRFGYNIGWKADITKATGINNSAGPCEAAPTVPAP